MSDSQSIDVGPLTFTILRILILVAFVRLVLRREWMIGPLHIVERLVIAWGIWGILASFLHPMPSEFTFVNRTGSIYNYWGLFFLIRNYCRSEEDVFRIVKITALVLVPVAAEMLLEQMTGVNQFSVFGGVRYDVAVRDGLRRAQGPFGHPILAGTVGAVCLPMVLGIWRRSKWYSFIGAAACVVMVITSGSSGPVASMILGILALAAWKLRRQTRNLRWAAVTTYVGLEVVMNRPAYYLITIADFTGSSTGWHRARLIESAFAHLDEWWLAGTNYTRHWMPTGVSWSQNHTDITNYYLSWGVRGGLLWMLLFIAIMVASFYLVGKTIELQNKKNHYEQFFVWACGASLFAHAGTCISVSYFDQSYLFFILTVAVISSLFANARRSNTRTPLRYS